MYKIGELSKLCNISVKTLRYYDAEGLLIPDMIDKFTGYRYYSASKLDDCYRIIALKELGFSLDEIRTQLTANDNEKITAALDSKIAELNQLIITTEKQLQKIEELRKNLTEGESKMFNILIRKIKIHITDVFSFYIIFRIEIYGGFYHSFPLSKIHC